MNSYSSSSYTPGPPNRPQHQHQHQYSSSNHSRQGSVPVRQTPPSAYQTPSQHKRSSQQQQQPQALYSTSYRANYDSPFTSPPPTVPKRAPLVLDPNNNKNNHHQDNYNDHASSHSRPSITGKLLEAVGMRSETTTASPSLVSFTTEHTPMSLKQQKQTAALPSTPSQMYQASYLTRNAPQAGFLYKLGTHIPEFKRRFFVLKPTTHLYYFLSPNDPEPRGRVDLEGSQIEELDEPPLPDGRYRFTITWQDSHKQVIVLEARSKQVGHEWMEKLRGERVSTLKDQVSQLSIQTTQQQEQILEYKKQMEHFRMVETDRDGALEDARNSKAQVERLDEALRRLTQQVRRPPPTTNTSVENNDNDDAATPITKNSHKENDAMVMEEKKDTIEEEDSDALLVLNKKSSGDGPNSSVLDMTATEEESREEINWDTFQVPGTYFFALSNACQQQRESLRLASIEANTAVEDLQICNETLATQSKRMEKAEKQIVKLWEENCIIRKTLKQKKREKRVLVREVKALQQVVAEEKARPRKSPTKEPDVVDATAATAALSQSSQPAMEDTMIGSDEERLIDELEEHIASSIRMHQRFLAGGGDDDYEANTSMEGSEIVQTYPTSSRITASGATLRYGSSSSVSEQSGRLSPLQPKLLSLFDDEASDGASDDEEDTDHYYDDGYQSVAPSISSVGAEYGDGTDSLFSSGAPLEAIDSGDDNDSSTERPHPVLQLDQDEEDDYYDQQQPHLGAAFTQSAFSKSVITDNGQATSRLVCPLADVRETSSNIGGSLEKTNEDLQVYHLSFYTQKIGIQFQKAPPTPARPKGLLTDAMTADLTGDKNGSGKTATELKNIAAISSLANSGQDQHGQDICQIASPKDVVLVCGFQGFDDSGNNQRPNLGARLVAFDGISVEIGPWTFDSIRKAIKARGRPLTLSFRNDFLTSDQRAVLTKAVAEMEASAPPPRRTIQYRTQERPPSTTPSINSAISHESDNFVNDADNRTTLSDETDLSAYASSAASSHCFAKRTLSSNSLSTHQSQYRRPSASNSVSTHQSNNFRSFSEAGTSSVISTTFAPLMANLLKNVSARRGEEFTPDYLRRDQESSEHTPQHQDFQSNLL